MMQHFTPHKLFRLANYLVPTILPIYTTLQQNKLHIVLIDPHGNKSNDLFLPSLFHSYCS